jgi:hypothetical protein
VSRAAARVMKTLHSETEPVSKAIPITGRGGLWGCEMLRIPHCLGNRLTDGSKVVRLMHRPRSTLQKHFSASGTHFCYRLSKPLGLVQLE